LLILELTKDGFVVLFNVIEAKHTMSSTSTEFKVGSIVWAKFSSFPYWPAQVVDEDEIKQYEKLPKKNNPNSLLVRFYSSNDLSFIAPKFILDYAENRNHFKRKSQSNKLKKSIEECEKALERKGNSRTENKKTEGKELEPPKKKKAKLTTLKTTPNNSNDEKRMKNKVKLTTKKIGLLAYGSYSLKIAQRLIDTGHSVTLWYMNKAKNEKGAVTDATTVDTPEEVVKNSEFIFVCLETLKNSQKVLEKLIKTNEVDKSKSFIEMSTMHSVNSETLFKIVNEKGCKYLEAPFFGSLEDASNGSLVVYTSGSKTVHKNCDSCFNALASKFEFLGKLGNAMTQMTMLNGMGANLYISTLEAYSTAEKAGLDLDILTDVIRNSKLNSKFMNSRLNEIMTGKYRTSYPLHLQSCYAEQMLGLAENTNINLPIPKAVHESLKGGRKPEDIKH